VPVLEPGNSGCFKSSEEILSHANTLLIHLKLVRVVEKTDLVITSCVKGYARNQPCGLRYELYFARVLREI